MADNSFCNLSDKGYAFTIHKEEVITKELQHFRVALQIMAGHPEILNEFKKAVMSGANHLAEGPTATAGDRIDKIREGPPDI